MDIETFQDIIIGKTKLYWHIVDVNTICRSFSKNTTDIELLLNNNLIPFTVKNYVEHIRIDISMSNYIQKQRDNKLNQILNDR